MRDERPCVDCPDRHAYFGLQEERFERHTAQQNLFLTEIENDSHMFEL